MDDAGSDVVSAIVSPFADGAPVGEDLRLDITSQSPYFRLRDVQSNARSEERRAESEPELFGRSLELWAEVVELASRALAERSKDLEIAAWLTEGLTRRGGLAGFATGARILAGLLENFWGRGLHPQPEPDDPWGALSVITGLSGAGRPGSLIPALQRTMLFEHTDGTQVTLWSYDYARELSLLDPERLSQTRIAAVVPPFAALEVTARGPGRHRMAALLGEIDEALAAWRAVEAAIAASGAPDISTGRVLEVLERIRRIATLYVPEAEHVPEPTTDEAQTDGKPQAAPEARAPRAAQPTREEMFEQVLQIARVFRDREPNSPFSLTLEEAVRRARLPLTQLLREVMPDDHQRLAVLTAFGIRVTFDE